MRRNVTLTLKADTRPLRAALLEIELSLTRGPVRRWKLRRKLREVKREAAP